MDVPASVAAYVEDGGIRRAVDELLDLGEDGVLEGLDRSELGRFYRAQLAARQLASEWAVFGLDAWTAVWGGLLDHWTALSPDEQSRSDCDAALDLVSLRDTNDGSLWFGRLFTRGVWTLHVAVAAVPTVGLRIKMSCETSSRRRVAFSGLAPAPDDIGNWVPEPSAALTAGPFEPGRLVVLARQAVVIADRSGGSSGARKV